MSTARQGPAEEPLPSRFARPERLLPFACVAAAGALFASELMTTFQLIPSGGDALCSLNAADRHHFALGVLAVFAVVAVVVAVLAASKPAATAVAVAGVLALLLFLIVDLPKANNVGTLSGCSPSTTDSFFDAKAVPQAGFWLEMVGALGLALSGAALATLSRDQLATLRPRWLSRGNGTLKSGPPAATTTPLPDPESPPITGGEGDVPAEPHPRARGARRT